MDNFFGVERKDKFSVSETALACVLFIVFNFAFILIYTSFPLNVRQNDFVYYLASALLEGTFGLAAFVVAKSRKIDLKTASCMDKKVNGTIVWNCFLIALVCLIFFSPLTNLFIELLTSLGYKSILSDFEINTFGKYLIYVVISCAVPAFCEDLLFRGVIASGLKKYGDKIAIILSAVIFTLMHGNAEQTVHQFVVGLILGFVFIKSGNLWIGVLIHFFNNFISVSIMYFTSLIPVTEETAEVVEVETATSVSAYSVVSDIVFAIIFAVIGYYFVKKLILTVIAENSKINVENKEQKIDSNVVLIDGEEVDTEIVVDDGTNKDKKQEDAKPLSTADVVMFAFSALYLVYDWIMALIQGFGG